MNLFFPKKYILIAILLFAFVFSNSCKKNEKDSQLSSSQNSQQTDSILNPYSPTLIKFKNKVFSVPSPIQVSQVAVKENIPFDPQLLNLPENYTKYLTTFKQAVNLGVYGADLAYLNIYDQISEFSTYFNIVKKLSEQLDLISAISEQTLDRIERNSENKDSLIYILSTLFRDIDTYLSENQQQKTGIIILAGGWVESIYALTQLYQKQPSESLLEKIGEQKTALNNLIQLLEPYYNQGDKDIDTLYESLADISSYFDAVDMTYEYESPEVFPEKHLTIIHSKTIVKVDYFDLEKITKKIKELRYWIIN